MSSAAIDRPHAPEGLSAAGDAMRSLLYTSGSPFARGVRVLLDELGLDCARNEALSAPGADDPASAPTLQVPVLRDGAVTLWESGTIAEYLLATYPERPAATPPLAQLAFRLKEPWRDRLVFSTIQTFGLPCIWMPRSTCRIWARFVSMSPGAGCSM